MPVAAQQRQRESLPGGPDQHCTIRTAQSALWRLAVDLPARIAQKSAGSKGKLA
jgi:hypothetical protein